MCELRDAVLQVEWFRKVNRDGFEAIAAKIARLTAIRSDTVSNGQITRSKTSGWKGEGRREDACVQCATPLRVEESLRATKGVRQTEHEAQQTLELLDEAISGLDESVVGKAREGREVMACVPCAKSLRSSYLSNKPGHLDESTGDHHDIDGEHGTTYQSLGIRSACILMPSLGSADQIYLSILEDDPARLTRLLASESGVQQQTLSKEAATSYSNLLRFAISKRAIACAHLLIEGLQVTREPQDAPQHRYLHELIINIGRRKTPSCQSDTLSSQSITNRANGVVDSVQFFRAILEKLSSEHMHMLVERDDEGRLPIHYAAMYGLSEVYSLLSERMQSCELSPYGVEEILLVEDGEQLTPLHLAVIGGHPETVEAILAHHPKMRADDMSSEMPRDELLSSNVLEIALRLNRLEICYSLIAHGIGLAYRGAHDMTPLHTAATLGFTACVEILLAMGPRYNLKVDDCETLNGWTPLMFACVRGELDVVLPLLEAGANTKQRDFLGWTGIDHASLRGYVYITHALVAIDPSVIPPIEISNMINRSSRSRPIDVGYTQTNGHSSSKKQRSALRKSRVVVNLGSLGPNTEVDAVKLNKSSLCSRPDIPAGLAKFRLEVRSLYSSGNTYSYQLPILGGKVYEPCLFDLDDPDQAGLAFNIYHATSDPRVPEVLTASGVALLPNLRKCLGQQRESLVRYHTIPLLGTKSLDYAGTITFSFIVVRPFSHPNVGRMPAWQVPTSTNVVGHRGNGENMVSRKNLQLGENTIPSFQAAVNLGASAIETDVQLTKDLVPVLYHDFTVCETGLDAPMNTLSLDQFMHLNAVQLTESRAPSFGPQLLTEQGSSTPPQRSRANSLGSAQGSRASDLRKRMEQTFEFKLRGIKGNTLETAVRQPFVTLKELLTADIREDVALYIEISKILHRAIAKIFSHPANIIAIQNTLCSPKQQKNGTWTATR